MKQYEYANPLRGNHLTIIEEMVKEYKDKNVTVVGLGKGTQHIFVDDQYKMTVNWNLI